MPDLSDVSHALFDVNKTIKDSISDVNEKGGGMLKENALEKPSMSAAISTQPSNVSFGDSALISKIREILSIWTRKWTIIWRI